VWDQHNAPSNESALLPDYTVSYRNRPGSNRGSATVTRCADNIIPWGSRRLPSSWLAMILCFFILHYWSFSSRHNHFLKLFLSPCSSVYLLSSAFPFYLSIKTSLFLLFFLLYFLHRLFLISLFFLSQTLPPLNFPFPLLRFPCYIFNF